MIGTDRGSRETLLCRVRSHDDAKHDGEEDCGVANGEAPSPFLNKGCIFRAEKWPAIHQSLHRSRLHRIWRRICSAPVLWSRAAVHCVRRGPLGTIIHWCSAV